MSDKDVLYVGIGGHVVAVRRSTGEELWRRKLKSSSFVTLAVSPDAIFAGAAGELFCLERQSGDIRWKNRLGRLGTGLVSFGDATAQGSAAAATNAAIVATAAAVGAAAGSGGG